MTPERVLWPDRFGLKSDSRQSRRGLLVTHGADMEQRTAPEAVGCRKIAIADRDPPFSNVFYRSAATRLATDSHFWLLVFVSRAGRPLVPFAKARLGIDDGALGILLLCVGMGSIVAMTHTGPLSARYGSKPVIVVRDRYGRGVTVPADCTHSREPGAMFGAGPRFA